VRRENEKVRERALLRSSQGTNSGTAGEAAKASQVASPGTWPVRPSTSFPDTSAIQRFKTAWHLRCWIRKVQDMARDKVPSELPRGTLSVPAFSQ
jgi:hypothetical protein